MTPSNPHPRGRRPRDGQLIVLLDLNYTLVGNSPEQRHVRPPQKKIAGETYRRQLVELCRPHFTILITARPQKQIEWSLASIAEKLDGWQPDLALFNENRDWRPEQWKRYALEEYVFPVCGNDASRFLALESNPRTRSMYAGFGIMALQVSGTSAAKTTRAPDEQQAVLL